LTQSTCILNNFHTVFLSHTPTNQGVDLVRGENLIQLLVSGADNWNAFRCLHPGCVMLNRISLPEAQLAGADLHHAFLLESDFHRAILARARLEGAILRKINLHGCDLRSARFDGADLFAADLSGADMRDASLTATFLKQADLRGADLSTAHGLTESQIVDAVGNEETRLPGNLSRPLCWSTKGNH
jgi:uncharacterized protein YjbI with pentapeptide repeats